MSNATRTIDDNDTWAFKNALALSSVTGPLSITGNTVVDGTLGVTGTLTPQSTIIVPTVQDLTNQVFAGTTNPGTQTLNDGVLRHQTSGIIPNFTLYKLPAWIRRNFIIFNIPAQTIAATSTTAVSFSGNTTTGTDALLWPFTITNTYPTTTLNISNTSPVATATAGARIYFRLTLTWTTTPPTNLPNNVSYLNFITNPGPSQTLISTPLTVGANAQVVNVVSNMPAATLTLPITLAVNYINNGAVVNGWGGSLCIEIM